MKKVIVICLITSCLFEQPFLAMELASGNPQPTTNRVILACAGTASTFDGETFHRKLHTLYNLSPEAIEVKDHSLSAEEKAQVKKRFLSYVAVILNAPIQDDKFFVDLAWITPLPTIDSKPVEPKITKPTLWHKLADPVTLTFEAGCALATWLAIKNLKHTTE